MQEANPYMNWPPEDIREALKTEQDEEKLLKMRSALKQWERQFDGRWYPYRSKISLASQLRKIAEVLQPAQNLNYYQDTEVPDGFEAILDSLENVHDNFNYDRFDYSRQGERPVRDVDGLNGDFLSPSEPVMDKNVNTVKPEGDGPDPEGLECPFPPTGGDLDGFYDLLS